MDPTTEGRSNISDTFVQLLAFNIAYANESIQGGKKHKNNMR